MATPILATKLYIPPLRPKVVLRRRLIERLNDGLHHKLTLVSAPAGFGKTTLVSAWVAGCEQPVAWLSLDTADNDPARCLVYLVAALQTAAPSTGGELLAVLQSPQPPPTETILTALLNEIGALPRQVVLVLDDYHVIDAPAVDEALSFLLEHLPPQLHLVMTTREEPPFPLARLRARGQLTELRATDLRFTALEAAEFLNTVMGLSLSVGDIAALEARTEGWIAGLQLAALSLQGQADAAGFIRAFTGSHHFVLDYLVEEVLQQQPANIQKFLLHSSILDRLCGGLCEAVLLAPPGSGQVTLEAIERANLFIVPLDSERRWYRYHHLFADLLRQRLSQSMASSTEAAMERVSELHIRASQWHEDHGLELEAFHHAAAGHDLERTERLMEGIPLHFRGAATTLLAWLEALPTTVLNDRPALWWKYASLLLVTGQTTGVEEKLQAAEAALRGAATDAQTHNLIGQIATTRATLALTQYQVEPMLIQSRRALEYLHPNNLSERATAHVALGHAYVLQGDRASARKTLTEAIKLSRAGGDTFTAIVATIGLGQVQETENQLHQATETYQRVLQLAGEQPLQLISEAYRGLARIGYEWNDLETAERYGRQSLHLARQYGSGIDRYIISEVLLARLKLAQGDLPGAAVILAEADQSARQHNFVSRRPEIAAVQVLLLLQQGRLAAAADLARTHELPLSQARVHLAQGDTAAALAVLEPYQQQMEAKGWADERLRVMVLLALALQARGEKDQAWQVLGDALALAEPGGFIRSFVDEGPPMARLVREAAARGVRSDYIGKLLAAFRTDQHGREDKANLPPAQPLIEPLSPRELEVLQLIAQGLSNREISERLFLALVTVKVHNQNIFGKLGVRRRTEAVARARELGLL